MIKLIAFDMDGTLTDSTRIITTAVNTTLGEYYNCPPLRQEQVIPHVGFGAKSLLKGICGEAGLDADIEEMFLHYDKVYSELPPELAVPYPGIREMLEALGAKGIRRVVLSNRPHNQTLRIAGSLLGDCLDEIYGQREGIPMKPDPTALHMILKENQCSLEECLYMGDMHFDINVAKNAGVRSVGCPWGFGGIEQMKEADILLEHPMDLLKHLG